MSGSDPFLQIHRLSKNILGKNEWIRPISTDTYKIHGKKIGFVQSA